MAGSGRVVAGSAGGIQLAAAGPGTRPLADRVKQAVFGSLEPLLPGAAVLDLCAGSGAAAIEALSRGAARAVLVERDAGAVGVIRENLRRTGLAAAARRGPPRRRGRPSRPGRCAASRSTSRSWTRPTPRRRFATPSWPSSPRRTGPCGAGATVVVTAYWREPPPDEVGLLRSVRVRRFGETAITLYRRDPGGVAAAD